MLRRLVPALVLLRCALAAPTDACEKCQCSDFCTGYDVVRVKKSTSCLVNCRAQNLDTMPTAIPANVETFVLADNAFTVLPITAFDALTQLRHLDLSSNFLTQASLWSPATTAPVVAARGLFDYLERLEHLDLSNNLVSSLAATTTFSTPFRKMQPKATWASLAGAAATAAPGGGLRSLTYLDLSGNQQGVAFPAAAIDGLKETLVTLNAYSMGLQGALPAGVGALTELKHLDLSFGRLSGALPAQLALLTKLTHLNVYSNRFQGAIPDLSANAALVTLHLGQNELTGAVPHAQLRTLASLKELYLHGNRLTGTVPSFSELPYTQYDVCYFVQNKFSCGAGLPVGGAGDGAYNGRSPCGLAGAGAGGCT